MSERIAYFRPQGGESVVFTDGLVRVLKTSHASLGAYRVRYIKPTDNQRGAGDFTAYKAELDFKHRYVLAYQTKTENKENNVSTDDLLDNGTKKKPKYNIPSINRVKTSKERQEDVQAILATIDSYHDAAEAIDAYYNQAMEV